MVKLRKQNQPPPVDLPIVWSLMKPLEVYIKSRNKFPLMEL